MLPAQDNLAQRLRLRLDASGLVFWMFDANGTILATTDASRQLWTAPDMIARVLATGADPAHIAPGVWAASTTLDEPCRGSRVIVAALGDEFAPGAVAGFTRFSTDSALAMLAIATGWVGDACRLVDHDTTIDGFTTQLSQAFDNIDCLYAMGRAMHDPSNPKEFLRFVCERLRGSTDFSWVSARFAGEDDAAATLTDKFYLSGTPIAEIGDVVRISGELSRGTRTHPGAEILPLVPGLSGSSNPQVLLHPIQRGAGPGGALLAGDKRGAELEVSSWDIQLFEAAAGFIASYLENVALYEDQRRLFLGTVMALTAAIDAKDRYTRGHSERVAHIASMLAREAGMDDSQVERIRIAGLVHDVGKIGVPEGVLTKQGQLTESEFDAIKRHPQIGYGILQDIPMLKDVLPGVLHHHERWDGRGYPSGLSSEQIPLQARIIAVADTFDAMSSTRSYRPAMPRDKVLAELKRCAGSQFDPSLVPLFLRIDLAQFDLLVAKHAAGDASPLPMPQSPTSLAA